jgi:hypothetical protein
MAEILNEFAFRQGGKGSKHDWDTLLDGRIRRLGKDDMGKASLRTMAASAHRNAKARGKKVRMSINKQAHEIVMQAYTVPQKNGEADAEATGEPAKGATAKRSRKGAKQQ